ncbi:MAG: type II toxin-antitoxin system PemK/MazF family toxin [Bacteroidota bacterium]
MKKGDIILVPFPFTDLTDSKNRPALVLIDSELDVTLAFISTQIHWKETYDILLKPDAENGLKKESLIRLSKLATIDNDLVFGRLGQIDSLTMSIVNTNLKLLLKLDE